MLHATNCNKAETKVLHDCFSFVTALLQFVACNMLHSVWWALDTNTSLGLSYMYCEPAKDNSYYRELLSCMGVKLTVNPFPRANANIIFCSRNKVSETCIPYTVLFVLYI